tara:strand:- start:8351 stop:8722 length:372 start_codon:yes stop_codon:yes gene_type:complete
MATMLSRDTRTFVAGSDLTAAQFKFVSLAADGQVDVTASAGGNAIGILSNNPDVGQAATVTVTGGYMVEAGGTITAGDQIQSSATGTALLAATGDVVLGYAREDAVIGQIMRIEFITGGNLAA